MPRLQACFKPSLLRSARHTWYTRSMSRPTHHSDTKILAFVGLPGAGKTSAVDYVTAKHYPKVYFGGVILQAMKEAGLAITPENERSFREAIRAREGNDFVAKRIITQIQDLIAAGQHRIVADGLYTWTEYKLLKQAFPGELLVVAIVAPRHTRHHRLTQRPYRPLTVSEATERDWAEIEHLEKGGPIAIADHFIDNRSHLDELHQQIDSLLKTIDF